MSPYAARPRLLVDRRGVGEPRRLARHGAQAEALGGVVGSALQLAVVERQPFALDILQEQLAVVAAGQRLVDHLAGFLLVERALAEEERVSGGEMVDAFCHGNTFSCSCGPPSSRTPHER